MAADQHPPDGDHPSQPGLPATGPGGSVLVNRPFQHPGAWAAQSGNAAQGTSPTPGDTPAGTPVGTAGVPGVPADGTNQAGFFGGAQRAGPAAADGTSAKRTEPVWPWGGPAAPALGSQPGVEQPAFAGTPAPPSVRPGPPTAESATSQGTPPPEPALETPDEPGSARAWLFDPGTLRVCGACLSSMIVHLVGLIVLGLCLVPALDRNGTVLSVTMLDELPEIEDEKLFETVFLDESVRPSAEFAFLSIGSPLVDLAPRAPLELGNPPPAATLLESHDGALRQALEGDEQRPSGEGDLLSQSAPGTTGVARAVVDDYQQALDRITQELLKLLNRRDVLVIWCFDQSESMKDDQEEIRARLERVYAELKMTGATDDDALTTAVTSFGEDFMVHTPVPTADVEEIRAAIEAVPVDPSGKEMMCRAVSHSIFAFRDYARKSNRQMALILVSDESGDVEENDKYLEPTISQAIAARCRVYVLGREAVFGYPFAHIRWVHPETGRVHWLPVDRGPETAFVEQLQTEGFEARTDAHPSGFGPYAQARLAWQTRGIFFLLPSVESDLVGGEKRRYRLETMAAYQPDLRSRAEIALEAQRKPLRGLVLKIVQDLNPHRPEVAEFMKPRKSFSADPKQFPKQLQEARSHADFYLAGLKRAIQALDAQKTARQREPSARWRADYDLLRAQLKAYAARVYLYRKALDAAGEKFEEAVKQTPPDRQFVGLRMREDGDLPLDDQAREMIAGAQRLYLEVIANHPGTPWAARAQWELERHFGYDRWPQATVVAMKDYQIDEPAHESDAGFEAGQPGIQTLALGETGEGVGAGVGVGGAGGGGGGGGGGGAGGGVGVGVGQGAGVEFFPGVELVAEYREPPKPRPADSGGRGRGGRRPGPRGGGGSRPTTPLPKL